MTVWKGRSPQRKQQLAACGRAATPVKIFLQNLSPLVGAHLSWVTVLLSRGRFHEAL
jgi:hypothetical protein